ncbi:serine hydrolase [Vreelandella malpeensis]|uniref:beta-lactamase n=1 Tax=Vreelandella malpeensis TaxID=1172368 RepID=A0ABS8DPJ7_9GAMM|nr:serine hydrolase [Halomonas malpeensis]
MRRLKRWLLGAALLVALPVQADWYFEVDKRSPWQTSLSTRIAAIEEALNGEVGVYVQDLQSGEAFSWKAEAPWYLASLVKVPVAAEILARRQAGELALDERLTLTPRHFVDGAGPVNWHDPGTPISIGYLLEQMITVSDNTASDMLIERAGLDAVNARARAMIAAAGGDPTRLGPITTLVGVRQGVYGEMHPQARELTGTDFMALRQHRLSERPAALASRLGVARQSLAAADYDAAFEAYEQGGENTAPLTVYGDLLATLNAGGLADLDAAERQALIEMMMRTRSGEARLKRGLGEGFRFAHKTGTQHRRSCDAGLAFASSSVASSSAGPWVVVACTRGPVALAPHEQALARVGEALVVTRALGHTTSGEP